MEVISPVLEAGGSKESVTGVLQTNGEHRKGEEKGVSAGGGGAVQVEGAAWPKSQKPPRQHTCI